MAGPALNMPVGPMTALRLRRIVFECNVAYATALRFGGSVQEAEWASAKKLRELCPAVNNDANGEVT